MMMVNKKSWKATISDNIHSQVITVVLYKDEIFVKILKVNVSTSNFLKGL